jgi:hypothetical protein
MAASAMTPTMLPVTGTMIFVSMVLVDRFENRCRPALGSSLLSSAILPRTQTTSAMDCRWSSIFISISWASRPTSWRPCLPWFDQALLFFTRLPLATLAATLPKFYRSAIQRCSICTTLIKSINKTITSVIAIAVRRRLCSLSERQQGRTLNYADRSLSAKSGRLAVASSLHPTHLLRHG